MYVFRGYIIEQGGGRDRHATGGFQVSSYPFLVWLHQINLLFQLSVFNLGLLIGLMSTGGWTQLGALAVNHKFKSHLS